MKKCLFIINPSSGQNILQNKLDQLIGKLVLQGIVNHVDVFYTQKKNDAYYKAKDTDEKDYDFFISVGGDGTLNEVISGMVDSHKHIPLCLMAAGTVNDFANYLNLPTEVDAIISMIKNFKTIKSDVGKINNQYFINVAAGGMFSDISFTVSKEDKKKFGPLAYYVNGLLNLHSQLKTNLELEIEANHQTLHLEAYMFAITNTNRVGGFDGLIPYADICDGKLDLMIVKRCSITDLIALFKDYSFGKHDKSPFIEYIQTSSMKISCLNQDVIIDIDGEQGSHLPVTIENVSQAITLLVP